MLVGLNARLKDLPRSRRAVRLLFRVSLQLFSTVFSLEGPTALPTESGHLHLVHEETATHHSRISSPICPSHA